MSADRPTDAKIDLVDVKELINKYTVEELNQTAEEYFSRLDNWDRLLAKPFASSNDAIHLLVQTSYLLQGLDLYPGMKVLDFGSGPGWASRILNQMGLAVISLDVSPTALAIGQELARRHPVFGDQPPHHFLRFDGRNIELADESIDRIFCLDAFHHVPNQQQALAEMNRVLRHGGIAGFAEPGPNHSKDPTSQLEMRNFKVIENDIVLEDILKISKGVGFTEMTVSIGTTYPLRAPLARFRNFLGDQLLVNEFIQSTADRITNFPIFFLHKGRLAVDDSRNMAGLVAKIVTPQSVSGKSGMPIVIDAVFQNTSNKKWLRSGVAPGSVNIGYFVHKLDAIGESQEALELRCHLSADVVMPGESVAAVVDLGQLKAGSYRVDIDLVSEHVRWFQANGSKIASVSVTVS